MSEYPDITDCLDWKDADFRYLRLRLQRQRQDNLQQELKARHENIDMLSQVLKECSIPFWIHGKTLLGIVRDKQLIIEDHDDDIGTFAEHRARVCSTAYPKLQACGFQAIRYNDAMLSVIRNDRYIDICFFQKKADKTGYGNKYLPMKYFEELGSVTFRGKEYPVPSKAQELLEVMYPDKDRHDTFALLGAFYKPIKKVKRKIKHARRWIESNVLQKKVVRPLALEEFCDCKIEAHTARNWTLRGPHLDLITDNGRLRKIGDIIQYFKEDSKLEYTKNNRLIEADTGQLFEEPINLNDKFWQTGNNYFFYCVYYGFIKEVTAYDKANEYIKNVGEPRLYSADYFEQRPSMTDAEIENLLRANPLIVHEGAIVHGKHRVCAMIGRLVAGEAYIPFYVEERVPRFAVKRSYVS